MARFDRIRLVGASAALAAAGNSALDKVTGKTVWETELPAGATGTAMTYMQAGKQYIVFAIGGQGHPAEFVAFALP